MVSVNINTALATKPCGCVIWMAFDPATLSLGPFFWFGDAPHRPLPEVGTRIARHTRGEKTQRPALRVLKVTNFTRLETIDELLHALFGTLER